MKGEIWCKRIQNMPRLTTATSPGKRALFVCLATCMCSSIQSAAFYSGSSPLRSHRCGLLKKYQKQSTKRCATKMLPTFWMSRRECGVRTFTSTTTSQFAATKDKTDSNTSNDVLPPQQPIVGFHLDKEGDWVAELECGHNQHVRHNPPMVERPWVLTEEGRNKFLGYPLSCKLCLTESTDISMSKK